jgi:hypothetical protein
MERYTHRSGQERTLQEPVKSPIPVALNNKLVTNAARRHTRAIGDTALSQPTIFEPQSICSVTLAAARRLVEPQGTQYLLMQPPVLLSLIEPQGTQYLLMQPPVLLIDRTTRYAVPFIATTTTARLLI